MNKLVYALLVSMLASMIGAATVLAAVELPGEDSNQPVALIGAAIHTVSGQSIPNGTLIIKDGRIAVIGDTEDVKVPADAKRISLTGRHIYPALFDAYTDMGLIEVPTIRGSRDEAEAGRINPNVKAQIAVNPDSEMIPVARANGVLLTLTAPRSGWIAGTSAVLQLDGWTWEDMTVAAPVALHMDWPRMTIGGSSGTRGNVSSTRARDKALQDIRQTFNDARAYARAKHAYANDQGPPVDFDARWEAMLDVIAGKVPIVVNADELAEIQSAVAFADRERVKLIIYGGYDAPHCAALLKKYDVPVIVSGTLRLPRRRDEPYDAPFTLPQRLRDAGVRFCISGGSRSGSSMVRNLPYHASQAAAYGLPRDEAIKAITLYPAQILGVADRVGSLEVGKDATLFVTTGDPLEMATNVTAAWIVGREVDLNNRHKRLWDKYEEKYRRQRAAEQLIAAPAGGQ